MEDKVLSIQQMNVLRYLGIDTSTASLYWWVGKDFELVAMKTKDYREVEPGDEPEEKRIDAFVVEDILDILPREIETDEAIYRRTIFWKGNDCIMAYCNEENFEDKLYVRYGNSILEASYFMLKSLKMQKAL